MRQTIVTPCRATHPRSASALATLLVGVGATLFSAATATGAHAIGPFTMGTATALPTSDGGTEPRNTVTPDGKHYTISNTGGTATVWESDDGATGGTSPEPSPTRPHPTIDVDIVSMPAGALIPAG